MSPTDFVIGVDGGGSKTLAVLADLEGRVHGVGRAGSSNYHDVGETAATDHLRAAVDEARRIADETIGGGAAARCVSSFFGLAGVVSRQDGAFAQRAAEAVIDTPNAHIGVDHDIRIALAGGLAGRPGVVVIAGTGSACYGRNADGAAWQAGGWGHLMADEGGGYWLGQGALVAAVQMFDGRLPESSLRERVMAQLGIDDMRDVMHRVYVQGVSRTEVAALAPTVLELAGQGDAVCERLIKRGAEELCQCITAVIAHLTLKDAEVTYAGGLIQEDGPTLAALKRQLEQELPQIRLVPPALPPVLGACLLALHRTPIEKDPMQNLMNSTSALY